MSNPVKISCLSGPSCETPDDFESATRSVIGQLDARLEQVLPEKPDIILLTECCDTPANRAPEWLKAFFRHRGNRVEDFLRRISADHRCHIAYSAILPHGLDAFHNATRLIDRKGDIIGTYRKNHLVPGERTDLSIVQGDEAPVFETDFGRVACAICFDLNFDELRLHYARQSPDLVLFSSMYHGSFMQQYWAYSCRAHFASCLKVTNPSAILSPVGQVLAESTNYHHFVTHTVNLDCVMIHLDGNRDKFPAIRRKYGARVRIQDPGRLGSVLLSSESESFTAREIVQEFGLELLDAYFERARSEREKNSFHKI